MAVLPDNGNASDHAVGMVAVSSWQGWLNHSPRPSEYEQPGLGASNLYRFWSTFTLWSPKSAFGYFKNGHAALVARQGGVLTRVVGFNPNSFLFAGLLQTLKGNDITVQGLWYDDTAMIHDPTAISYEINVTGDQAQVFRDHIAALIGRSDLGQHSPQDVQYFYSFRPAVTEPASDGIVGNCSNMALLILCQFLYEWHKENYVEKFIEWVNRNQNTKNFGQGQLMGAITSGFQ